MKNSNLDELIRESEARFISQNLPLFRSRFQILQHLDSHQCLVLQADTGLGKTTQLPQYLYLHYCKQSISRVICTQPRRLAAVGASKRVNDEFGSNQISTSCINKKDMSLIKDYPIVYFSEFMFLNYLLSEMYSQNPFQDYKAFILDEAHERNIEADVILALIKKYIQPKRPDFKIIITSATLEIEKLKKYLDCESIKCEGRNFPVQVIYLNQIYDNYFYETANTVIRVIRGKILKGTEKETILVFFAGYDEIFKAKSFISSKVPMEHVEILMLYGNLDFKEQQDIVNTQNKRIRVVISTNIAESSLTVPGVTCVVDSGREKASFSGQFKDFRVKLITKMSAAQRKGRAGRTNPGDCYRIYTKEEFDNMMDFREPAIMKSNIGLVLLKFVNFGIFDVFDLKFLDGPNPERIKAAYNELVNFRMIEKNDSYRIMGIGLFCYDIEISPMMAKFLYEAYYNYGCADEAVMLASLLIYVDFIFIRTDLAEEIDEDNREDYLSHPSIVTLGDMVNSLFIFRQYYSLYCDKCLYDQKHHNENCFCADTRRQWSQMYYINEKRLKSAVNTYTDLCDRLSEKLHTHIFYFSEEEWQDEQELARLSLVSTKTEEFQSLLLKIGQLYKTFYYTSFQKAIISSFFLNLAQYRGDKTIDAGYLYISTREIVVNHPSSPFGRQMFLKPPKYVMFYEISVTSNTFMKYITPVDINEVKKLCGPWLESQNFQEEIEEPEGLVFQNLGPLYMKEVFGPSGSRIYDLENELKKKGIHGVLILPDMNKNCLKLRLPASYRDDGEKHLREILNNKRKEVMRKNIVNIPFSKGMILVLNPGGIISDILYSEETLIFHLKDMKSYTNYSEALNDVQNTFEFYQFNYVKRPSDNLGVVYFKSAEQAAEAQTRLQNRPLMGKSSLITVLEPFEKSLPQPCLKIKTTIQGNKLRSMLEYFGAHKYLNIKVSNGVVIAYVRYIDQEGTLSCIEELTKWVFEETNSLATVQKLQQGILVPKELELLGLDLINNYIENINIKYNTDFHINGRNVLRIYADDSRTPQAAKEMIIDLVNFETLPISIEVLRCLEKSFLPVQGHQDLSWATWQNLYNVKCIFLNFRSSLAIYGVPEDRRVASEELQKFIGGLLKQIVNVNVSYSSVKELRKIELFKKKHFSELQVDININRRKATVSFTGIKRFVNLTIEKLKLEEKEEVDIENCSICTELLGDNVIMLSLCGHKFHIKCINYQIKASVSEALTGFPIGCVNCGHYLVHNDWCKVLSYTELQNFYNASLANFLTRNDRFSHCENPSCDFVYQTDVIQEQGNKRTCIRCKGEFCILCKRQIFGLGHEIKCEMKKIEKEEMENHAWIQENTVSCPSCFLRVEKSKGCNHIECPVCKCHFCFLCGDRINAAIPINHYIIPNTPCFQKYLDSGVPA